MDLLFLGVVVFLFMLAIFDLSVGVSNDAVNFLNSATGSRAASFKRILIVASAGVFIGAIMSNGMMDIARHGIFMPENFSFYEIICIFMAVMVTDIILLDIFNSLGMPTSTTVSMVFELLGATFVVSLIKLASDETGLSIADMLNTEKALSIIIGIFLSVAIAFVFGTVVQFLTRTWFTFNYKSKLTWKIGIFGGLCTTAIVYFLMIKGIKDLSFMTPELKLWIDHNTVLIILSCFVVSTLVMQMLHALKVNVFKVIVLMGTFALAMAFAGNDLVNFIGVPLSGLASFQDYAANGSGDPHSFMMSSLRGPANTPFYFLLGAGVIMVVSLATSKKAHNVIKTEVGLGSQSGGDEMFGSSRISRRLVRWTTSIIDHVRRVTPPRVRQWFNRRFDIDQTIMDRGAAFDLVRGSINLVLAGALIALGTSMKLPLSTTFVTFMVAMGTSLADRAWGRESAVFRITGVMSVIGGWFLTAGVAFIGAGVIVALMYWGGHWVMFALALLTVVLLIRSNRKFRNKNKDNGGDALFQTILATEDRQKVWPLLHVYIRDNQQRFLSLASDSYMGVTEAFVKENLKVLDKCDDVLFKEKNTLKSERRKETLCLRQVPYELAIEKSPWFYLSNNCCMSMLYNLRRVCEVCKEHVEGNFRPLPAEYLPAYEELRSEIGVLFNDVLAMTEASAIETVPALRRHCDMIKDRISSSYHSLQEQLRSGDAGDITVIYIYINMLQETKEMVSSIRKYLRAYAKMIDPDYDSRRS